PYLCPLVMGNDVPFWPANGVKYHVPWTEVNRVEGYTEEIVHEFEQRIEMIFGRQVTAAGSPEAAKDAYVVNEGAQADPAPVQAPQLPPPPLAAGRNMPKR
nr:hypothetical protein [Tanacetum cinerariifolium]